MRHVLNPAISTCPRGRRSSPMFGAARHAGGVASGGIKQLSTASLSSARSANGAAKAPGTPRTPRRRGRPRDRDETTPVSDVAGGGERCERPRQPSLSWRGSRVDSAENFLSICRSGTWSASECGVWEWGKCVSACRSSGVSRARFLYEKTRDRDRDSRIVRR